MVPLRIADRTIGEAHGKQPTVGAAFELAVYTALQNAVSCGDLGLLERSCKITHGKRYYSQDRRSWMATDVSIELFAGKGRRPAILWVWECKNYDGAVPVSDVEEFHAKLEQLGADRTKGTIIASGRFQKGALKYAKSKGIGIARLLPARRIEWVFHTQRTRRRRLTVTDIAKALLSPSPDMQAHAARLPVLSGLGIFAGYPALRDYVVAEISAIAEKIRL